MEIAVNSLHRAIDELDKGDFGTGTRCWGEGIGPAGADREELLNAIAAQHPELVEHYGHIDWPHKRKTKGDNDEQNR